MQQEPGSEISNFPVWTSLGPKHVGGFQEVWYLKLNDVERERALWLRFTLLVSDNGFRKVAETWAVFFDRHGQTVALKQTHDIQAFSAQGTTGDEVIRIAECELSRRHTLGTMRSKNRTIKWDLTILPAQQAEFNLVPQTLKKAGIVKNSVVTVGEDLRFTGTCEIDGVQYSWNSAPGMQGHITGPKNGHSWVWGHCNSFQDENGKPVSFIFEGLSARAAVAGGLRTPQLSAFFFFYQGRPYAFNSLWDSLRIRSRHALKEWTFQADRGDLSFRGQARAELRDFAGLTYEDTDGTLLYCANSKLADLTMTVYRRGKLEATFKSHGSAAYEVVTRDKSPYVPTLI